MFIQTRFPRWQGAGANMFTALTFNMQNGQSWDDHDPDNAPIDLARTVDFLLSQSADIIFLQEVERGHEGGRQIEPPPHYEFLRSRLQGYHSVFGYPRPNPLEIPFGLGLAIFSRFPLDDVSRLDLPPADIPFEFEGRTRRPSHRLLLSASTEVEGHGVRLVNTHLQAFFMINATSDEHRTQRDMVERELHRCGTPVLLAGDFNCSPGDSLVRQFEEAGFHASQKDQITWRRRPYVLDHIFYNAPLRLESCRVIPTTASDHHAVRSEFSFIS